MLSSSECITWFAVVLIVSLAIVTVNLLSIILFIKNSDLRTRGMYLVINLTVADTLVGVISSLQFLLLQSNECKNAYSLNVRFNSFLFYWFPLTSLTNIAVISLDRMPCDISSIQASSCQKMGLRGNNFCCLGFSWNDINCNQHASVIRQRMVTPSLSIGIIFLVMYFCYMCLLRLDYCQNLLWGASTAPWCSPQAKKTDCNVTHHDYCIVTVVATICCSYLCLLYH